MHRVAIILLFAILLRGAARATLTPDVTFVEIPSSVLTTVGDILPESSNAGAAYVSESYSPNLVVTEACNVFVTFVWPASFATATRLGASVAKLKGNRSRHING